MSIIIHLDLPEEIAAQARAEGLLESGALVELLQQELRRRTAGLNLRQMMEQIHAAPGAAMNLEEIDAEIKAARAERRVREAGA